jgi:DNA-binding CsgD family transcriptional regulator
MSSTPAPLEEIPLGSTRLPIRFLGMGVYLAWLYSAHFGMTLFPFSSDGSELSLTFFASNVTTAICLIACALYAHKLAPLTKRRGALWAAGGLSTLGTVLTAAHGALGSGQFACLVVGSACTGLGTALLILLWSEFYASLPMRKVSVYYSLSFVLATLVNYLVALASPLLAIIITSLLPIISAVMLSSSMRILPARPNDDGLADDATKWTFPLRPVLLMAAYSFAFGFIREANGGTTSFGMIGVGLIALVVLAANLLFFHRFDTRLLYRLSLPLMVAALLVQPLFGSEGIVVADVLANASYAGFVILTMIILSSICFRFGVNALWLFGITRASRVVANVAGALLGESTVHASSTYLSTELMVVIVTLVTASLFLLNDQDFRSAWGIVPQPEAGSAKRFNYYETFLGRCAQVAREYGLTHREEEVLALLAQGKSVPAIEKDLVISNGTAKSHVRHIYSKLGIHSRDELIEIVGMRECTN